MAKGEAGALEGVWSRGADVTALHPIGGRDTGWQAVGISFDGAASIASAGDIRLTQQHILAVGDLACEVGVETGTLTLAGLAATRPLSGTRPRSRQGLGTSTALGKSGDGGTRAGDRQ